MYQKTLHLKIQQSWDDDTGLDLPYFRYGPLGNTKNKSKLHT